jgi:hypothetical protein
MLRSFEFFNDLEGVLFEWALRYDEATESEIALGLIALVAIKVFLSRFG